MNKKVVVFILLVTLGGKLKAQILLNLDSSKIKQTILSKEGVLRKHKKSEFATIANNSAPYYSEVYTFPPAAQKQSGIYMMTFYYSLENKCSKYLVYYWENPYKKELIKKLNSRNSGLKEVEYHQKWENITEHYTLTILKNISVNGKIGPAFFLEIKKN